MKTGDEIQGRSPCQKAAPSLSPPLYLRILWCGCRHDDRGLRGHRRVVAVRMVEVACEKHTIHVAKVGGTRLTVRSVALLQPPFGYVFVCVGVFAFVLFAAMFCSLV